MDKSFRGESENCVKVQGITMAKNIFLRAVDDVVYAGAQPFTSELPELKNRGIKTIVSLRKIDGNFRKRSIELGINLIDFSQAFIGTNYGDIEVQASYMRRFLVIAHSARETGIKVLVHCAAGIDRTPLFIQEYQTQKSLLEKAVKRTVGKVDLKKRAVPLSKKRVRR